METALYSKRVLLPKKGIVPATVLVEGATLAAVVENEQLATATDLGNLVLMPGVVDPHVHINEPGRTEWEGFETGTKAAAAGGITTLVDMPLNSSPVTTTVQALDAKIGAAHNQLRCNVGFWAGVVPENSAELGPLLDAGALGAKAFLCHSGIDEFPNVDEAELYSAMLQLKRRNKPLLAHCELVDQHPGITHLHESPGSYLAWLKSRPERYENSAIAMMIDLCRRTGCRTHIVHLSSASALAMIKAAQHEGLPLTVETCPHYLVFDAESIPDGDTRYKCAPPIRERENNEMLWHALKDGTLAFIATDHSPAPPSLKAIESGNLENAWGGIAGLQFSLPLVWTHAQQRGFAIEDVAKWLSSAPANFLGLHHQKGAIAAGFDADLVAWDPESSFVVEEQHIYHRHKPTPYLGMTLQGVVHQTWANGQITFNNHAFGDAIGRTILT